MAKRKKQEPESGPNVFDHPARVGMVVGGDVLYDCPAELRDGVLLRREHNARDEPTEWRPVKLDETGWCVTEASDGDLAQLRAAGYDGVEDRRGAPVIDRRGTTFALPPESDGPGGDPAAPGAGAAEAVIVRPMVMTADAEELADKRRRLEQIDAQEDIVAKAYEDFLVKRDAAKSAKATYEKESKRLRVVIRASKEDMPLFDAGRWESTPVGKLDIPAGVVARLADAGITTLGELAKHTADGRPLTTIKGIGPEAAEAIARATEEFWRRRPDRGEAA